MGNGEMERAKSRSLLAWGYTNKAYVSVGWAMPALRLGVAFQRAICVSPDMLPAIAHFFDCTRRRPVGYELPLTYLCFKI
jgi:hypothetical protein